LIKAGSKINGIGVFANKNFKKGETIYKIPEGRIINYPTRNSPFIGNNRWLSDEIVLNYVNHSCEPNAVFEIGEEPRLVAVEDIKEGDEITVDYNKTEIGGVETPCNCGSENCKGFFLSTGRRK